jgi:hypothetical protein
MTNEEILTRYAQRLVFQDVAKEAAKPRAIIVAVKDEPPSERPALHRAPAGERLH